jgi:hypothetical protein
MPAPQVLHRPTVKVAPYPLSAIAPQPTPRPRLTALWVTDPNGKLFCKWVIV